MREGKKGSWEGKRTEEEEEKAEGRRSWANPGQPALSRGTPWWQPLDLQGQLGSAAPQFQSIPPSPSHPVSMRQGCVLSRDHVPGTRPFRAESLCRPDRSLISAHVALEAPRPLMKSAASGRGQGQVSGSCLEVGGRFGPPRVGISVDSSGRPSLCNLEFSAATRKGPAGMAAARSQVRDRCWD